MLERVPDFTPIFGLQIDGIPEQLADWEAQQKQKRIDDKKEGKNQGKRSSGEVSSVKKDVSRGTTASSAAAWPPAEKLKHEAAAAAAAAEEAAKPTAAAPEPGEDE